MAQSENLDFQKNFKKFFHFLGRNIENLGSKNSKKISIFQTKIMHRHPKISLFSKFSEKSELLKISNEGH